MNKKKALAGLLLVIAGFIVFMGITTAEAYYPVVYSIAANVISDLGSTASPSSIIYQPSAAIFNFSMIMAGLLTSLAALLLHKSKTRKLLTIPLLSFGLGILGVGLFPANLVPHSFFALLTFTSGGIAAILTYKVTSGPFRYLTIAIGTIALTSLILSGVFKSNLAGGGFIERWIAYPITIWMIALGAYLMGDASSTNPHKKLV